MKDKALVGKFGEGHNDYDWLIIDPSTLAIVTLSLEHYKIHSGTSFTCSHTDTVTDTGNRTIITFKTPNSRKHLHVTASASATAASKACIREGSTYTDNAGATLAVYNRNRNSTNTPIVLDTSQSPDAAGSATKYVHDTANLPAEDGTLIANITLGQAGNPVQSVGGLARSQQEWELKPNTLYSFEVQSLDANDNTHWIELDWYEHEDEH